MAEAIRIALQNNRTLEKAGFDRESQRFDLRVAEDEFRPNLDLIYGVGYNPVTTSGTEVTTRSNSVTTAVTQRLPTGARFGIVWDNFETDRSSATTKVYDSNMSLQFDQPLLRGGGLQTNLAGLRIARLTESTNVLEYKKTIINAVTSVIYTYRALLQSQRQVEVTLSAVEKARQPAQGAYAMQASPQPRFELRGILQRVHTDRRIVGNRAVNIVAIFQHAQLLQFFDLFVTAERQRSEFGQQVCLVSVKPQVPMTGIGLHPLVVDRESQIARKRQPGTRKIQGPTIRPDDDLYLIRIIEIDDALKWGGQGGHGRPACQQSGQGLDLSGTDQGLVGLHVDDVRGLNRAIGLRNAIGPALMGWIRHDGLKPRPGHTVAQFGMIDGKPERNFRRLGTNSLGHQKQQRLALDLMQELAGEAGGLQPAGDDDRNIGHRCRDWRLVFKLQAGRS